MTLFTLAQVTPPASEPVSLTLAKQHLRVDGTADDTYITALIIAARVYAEHHCRRAFITQTWDMYFDQFHYFDTREIQIPLAPLQSVTWIKYTDTAQNIQTLATDQYVADGRQQPGRVYPAFAKYWPATLPLQNSVNIRFVAGYTNAAADAALAALVLAQAAYAAAATDANARILVAAQAAYDAAAVATVPQTIIQAILLLVSHFYENREPIVAERGVVPAEVPFAVDKLLDTEVVLEIP